ncbi:MAG TPA: hypothetical protein VNZ85_16270 [Caulobacter sp.]|nr:hypothetical protein [Caulobacter sp.]
MARKLAQAMLQAWEDGCAARAGERGLILLHLAEPTLSDADCRALSVGRRDAALLVLHERMFGPLARALVDCPACAGPLELDVPLAAIRVAPPEDVSEHFELAHEGQALTFRLPTAGDLADPSAASAGGLARLCLLEPEAPADSATVEALEAAIGAAVNLHDPQAVVSLAIDCPDCAAHWRSPFDIVEFLWRGFDRWADDLLAEIHVLASAYGWGEDQILALSQQRRRRYLGMIGA